MKVVYKNLLETKESVIVTVAEDVPVLINNQMYSELDDQSIIYSLIPIFGNKDIVFLDIARACTFAIYNEEDNTIQYSDTYQESLEDTLLTDEIYAVYSIDDIAFLNGFLKNHAFEFGYEELYIHAHPAKALPIYDDLPF